MAVFVRFMRDNCGFCQQSQAEWSKLQKMKVPVKLHEVRNNEQFTYNYKKHSRSSVPTYVLFNGKKEIEYNGDRTADAMLKFLQENKPKIGRLGTKRRGRGRARTRAARSSF